MAAKNSTTKSLIPNTSSVMQKKQSATPWTEKYRPKVPSDIIGNQSIVCIWLLSSYSLFNTEWVCRYNISSVLTNLLEKHVD